ncbi:MAG: IspD/TarI family cytidylyltransferase [Methanobrevibacter sp.]|uniref:IspD/TarI family cytidylyltransferase n=1 Tax=Methanobrevibacter sp. TaxID=66852 RepID=UPI002E76AEE6|nr:IspD/TarI family cytidylyltransferase [Methanobrevibacter sp.]MEE0935640.1 IspD/TarI family cytidylyltransferase [Methanobrevibacter sp.]
MVYAILLSGGVGSRTGFDIPKQFIKINNKPLLVYCIEKFVNISEFKKIIVSSPKDYLSDTKALISDFFPYDDRLVVIEGGETRQDTLMNSIYFIHNLIEEDACIVCHDAARIFVSESQIKSCIDYTNKYGASSPIIPSTDVIVELNGKNVSKMPNRFDMVHVQTPQGFFKNKYLKLYSNLSLEDISSVHEIIRVYYLNNEKIFLFDGEKSNFKVTTAIDIEMAKHILSR